MNGPSLAGRRRQALPSLPALLLRHFQRRALADVGGAGADHDIELAGLDHAFHGAGGPLQKFEQACEGSAGRTHLIAGSRIVEEGMRRSPRSSGARSASPQLSLPRQTPGCLR